MRARARAKISPAVRRRYAHLQKSLRVESAECVRTCRRQAEILVSGRIPAKGLRGVGHPFARKQESYFSIDRPGGNRASYRAMSGAAPLLPINIQSGRLVRSLRVFQRVRRDVISWTVQFTAPEAKYVLAVGGTKTMKDRGFWAALNAICIPFIKNKMAQLLRFK